MNEYLTLVVLCSFAQISAVALAGLLLTSLCIRFRPLAARTMAYATVIIMGLIMITSPLPVSNIARAIGLTSSWSAARVEDHRASTTAASAVLRPSPDADNERAGFDIVDPSRLVELWRTAIRATNDTQRSESRWGISLRLFALIVAIAACCGVARFIHSCIGASRILKNATPVMDSRLQRMSQRLCRDLNIDCGAVVLVQSDAVESAAVIHWRRPHVVLPACWQSWGDSRIRSVLAHELGHVLANDFWWRTVSCLVVAVNFGNPIVAMLFRRVVLCQELIADSVAHQAIGRRNYMKTLATFALEMDRASGRFTTGIAPVLTCDLIRRIKMLDRMDLASFGRKSRPLQAIGLGTLLLMGVTVFAARGFTQDVVDGTPGLAPSARIARLEHRDPNRTVDPTLGMFHRKPVDLERHLPYETGFLCARLGEFFDATNATNAGYLPLLNVTTATAIRPENPMPFDLSIVDRIEGAAVITSNYRQTGFGADEKDDDLAARAESRAADSEKTSQTQAGQRDSKLAVGANDMQIHFDRDVDSLDWAKRFGNPGEIVGNERGQIWRLSSPSLGPLPMGLANLNKHTVCVSNCSAPSIPVENPKDMTDRVAVQLSHSPAANRAAWVPMYLRSAGGLFTAVFTNCEIQTQHTDLNATDALADDFEIACGKCFDHILHTYKTFSVGFDLSADAKTVGVRIRVGYETADQASEAHAKVIDVLTVVQDTGIDSEAEFADEFERTLGEFLIGLSNKGLVDVRENSDGTADVYLAGTVDLPMQAGALIKSILAEEPEPTIPQ